MPASENLDANGKPRKLRKLLPDAVPTIGIGKNPTDAATPSGTSGLVLDPGTSFDNAPVPDIEMEISEVENAVDLEN